MLIAKYILHQIFKILPFMEQKFPCLLQCPTARGSHRTDLCCGTHPAVQVSTFTMSGGEGNCLRQNQALKRRLSMSPRQDKVYCTAAKINLYVVTEHAQCLLLKTAVQCLVVLDAGKLPLKASCFKCYRPDLLHQCPGRTCRNEELVLQNFQD
jgi:hypothetical protein